MKYDTKKVYIFEDEIAFSHSYIAVYIYSGGKRDASTKKINEFILFYFFAINRLLAGNTIEKK